MVVLRHVVVPVANGEDVAETTTALEPYLERVHRATVVHVIETRPNAVDKAPVEKRRADAREFLAAFESRLDADVTVETRIVAGTDVAETAREAGATAVAFRSRGGGRLARLLSGNTTERLVTDPDVPVLSLPGADSSPVASTPRGERGGS